MKALVIAPQPFFTPRGTPFSVYYRTLIMAEAGVEIDLLTYGIGEDVDIPGVRIERIPRLPGLGSVRVGPSLRKAILDLPLFYRASRMLRRTRYDFVHAHEEAAFFCLLLRRFHRFRFLYDMHSSLPQQLVNFEFTRSRALRGLFQRLEDGCLRTADAVITISPALAEYATARMPDPRRHLLIENSLLDPIRLRDGADTGELAPAPTGSEDTPDMPDGRQVIAYAGTFEPYQGLDTLMRAFAMVAARRPDAFLFMAGGDPRQTEQYRRLAGELGIGDSSLVLARLPQAEVRRRLAKAAVLVSPRSVGDNTPLKVYEQLASGIPLVATRISSHTQVLDDDVCLLVEPEPRSMADGLLEVLEHPAQAAERSRRAREFYETEYSRDAYERKIASLLDMLRPPDGGS